jgi:hypothetical protein
MEYFFRVTISLDGQWDNYETVARNKFEAINDVLSYVEGAELISVDCLGEARSEDE